MSKPTLAGMIAHTSPEVALMWHLQHNHYPQLPVSLVPVCVTAIERAVEAWDFGEERSLDEQRLDLPANVLWQGSSSASVASIIDAAHLHDFIEDGKEEVRTCNWCDVAHDGCPLRTREGFTCPIGRVVDEYVERT